MRRGTCLAVLPEKNLYLFVSDVTELETPSTAFDRQAYLATLHITGYRQAIQTTQRGGFLVIIILFKNDLSYTPEVRPP